MAQQHREPPEPTHDPSDPGYHDPGDAVPEGVAPAEPVPLTEQDRQAKRQLERLPKRDGKAR